ncbi:transcriptional regulator ATRX homolog [Paramacrobiotus metropolitanus]|uniref:transcriptional regulator ATRX homolog n=1 Tax=Paramacrobiotus metropolitanus TaxID=2943436 RepID=UPI002445B87F|nr:transcriptional regulator ATRX homolog [Paramacrobiotus metropolitanus]
MMKHVVSKVANEEDAWIRIKVGTNDDHLAYTYTTDGKLLTKERTRSKPTADPDPKKRSSDDYESVLRYTEATSRKFTLRLFAGNGEVVETITAVIVDPITGDPIPYAPWDVSEESARNANQAAIEQLWNLIPESEREDSVVQASTLISMMRHRAEIDEAHFRLTRRMEDGSYKTVFYDAKKNPLWEVASPGQTKETAHLEIQPPAQEGGAEETEEAQGTSTNVTETGGARRSLQRVLEIAQGSHDHLQCDEPNCAHCNAPGDAEPESEDEDSAEEEVDSDEEMVDKHKKPLRVAKQRKAPKLEEAMNREKVKKGEFLKKRREEEDKKKRKEEEDKKKKSGDESDSTSTGKKRTEREKKDKPSSHDVEILDESVGEVEERSSTPTTSKKVIQSATSKSKVNEPDSPKTKGKVIAVKQVVPIVISASTPKERKDKQIREKAKRETSR